MHELSVAKEILRIIEAERARHDFSTVSVVRIKAGALSGINPHALQFAFEVAREGTCAAGAEIEMDREPMRFACRQCPWSAPADASPDRCPDCGSARLELKGTTNFDLVSLDVD